MVVAPPRSYPRLQRKKPYGRRGRRRLGRRKARTTGKPYPNVSNDLGGLIPLSKTIFKSSPFPRRKVCRMAFQEWNNLVTQTLSNTFGTEIIFRLNSLNAPSFQAATHQPYGYDQLTPLYSKYKVHGVRLQVVFSDPTIDGLYGGVAIQQPGDAATLTNLAVDRGGDKYNIAVVPINNTGSQVVVLDEYYSMAKLSGLTKTQWKADTSNYSAAYNADPTNVPYVRIAIANPNATVTTYNCGCMVKIIYYCEWFDKLSPAIS